MLKRNKPLFVTAFLLIIISVLLGSIASLRMDSKTAEHLGKSFQTSINNGGFADAFIKSAAENGKILLTIWVLGMTPLVPLPSLCVIAYRSFAIGYTSTYLITSFSLKGVLMTAVSVFPHNLLLISTFILLTIAANDTKKNKQMHPEKVFSPYNKFFILCVILTLVGCSTEAFVSSSLMRAIANITA